MNMMEFYSGIPVARHEQVIVSGDRLFYEDDEYLICDGGELKLIKSPKRIEERLARIEAALAGK